MQPSPSSIHRERSPSLDYQNNSRIRKRNEAFQSSHHPLKHHQTLRLDRNRITGPVSFLNPTSAHFRLISDLTKHTETSSDPADNHLKIFPSRSLPHDFQPAPSISYKWTSRNNRKSRHALAVNPVVLSESKHLAPPKTASPREVGRGIWRMVTVFPTWDISYDVAIIFTLGSVIWVINAFFVYLPLVQPDTEFKNEELYGGGITAFIGATIFEFGSFLLMAEAINENRMGCFGWAVERAFSHDIEEGSDTVHLEPSKSTCTHHHFNKRNLVGRGRAPIESHNSAINASPSPPSPTTVQPPKTWIWFPSKSDLRKHYLHELGFLASFAQLIGATIFWFSGFTTLPGIYNKMSRPITIIFYWTPQILGGTGFIISGTLFMLETQSRWYKPAFKTIGWWIGAWNLIGGVGFTLCPAFGYNEDSWAQYQACLSTFWGSWAFLVGSVVQWYESLDKHPVEIDKTLRDDKNGKGRKEVNNPEPSG
ncbi:hypothetical protein K469DRAFT_720146 [Zopfia rhizophila CBS 207.26]|uniref:Integral membrane protein n=1 Tax=Zopfia rhizophila CBS 207.26 TaxID=1314779 RepID=A0A6A6EGI1_9PEZI|nr:hypothetical protein K469DRAFT_720146 [Zopfia rhizophila CBS 207.26]